MLSFKHARHATSGYLLVYGEADGFDRPRAVKSLENRFRIRFPNTLGSHWRLITFSIGSDEYYDEKRKKHLAWAIALYRYVAANARRNATSVA